MSAKVGQVERATQDRVVKLFHTKLGYEYLGNWEDQAQTSPIVDEMLRKNLTKRGYAPTLIALALAELHRVVANHSESLYKRNRELYTMLRYGVKVRPEAGATKETVELVAWDDVEANDFALAEEVTVKGNNTKRPDVVLYLNGLAVAVLELKRSKVSVHEGIRQNLDNQTATFIQDFFGTVQLVMAGNDTEGMRYGTVGTTEKYYLEWREEKSKPTGATSPPGPASARSAESKKEGEPDVEPLPSGEVNLMEKWSKPAPETGGHATLRLDEELSNLCNRERLLTLLHDFVVFDRGIKKLCRPNQFFGVRAAQQYIKKHEGGIIWHTQGSGKSLTMVWLTKWLLENDPEARVLLVTDRDELDEQIEKVFKGVEQKIYRTKSGADLVAKLSEATPRLLCSLMSDTEACKYPGVLVAEPHIVPSGLVQYILEEWLNDTLLEDDWCLPGVLE